jgi:hypothetical protein
MRKRIIDESFTFSSWYAYHWKYAEGIWELPFVRYINYIVIVVSEFK